MRITFLGTGGGRVVVTTQTRASGGWVLEMDGQVLHVDPGPGALVRAREYGIDLRRTTGILVSHAHPDHYADAEMIVEAMTCWNNRKRGVIIGDSHAIDGGKSYRPVFSPYHLDAVSRHVAIRPGESTEIGKVRVMATKTRHDGDGGIGFVFEGEKRIGYTSDGEYYEGMEDYFRGCDLLIMNCLRPRDEKWPTHMNTNHAMELVKKSSPGMAVINHFGMKMLKTGPEKEAAWIEEETGIRTVASRDGMVLESRNGEIVTGRPHKKGGRGGPEKGDLRGFLD